MSAIDKAAQPIALEDLAVLNDELAALARVGIPLEVGLGGSRRAPQRLRAIVERLRGEMELGASLDEALRKCASQLPPSYLALVEAGLRSNRLSESLAAAARFTRTMIEMQQYLRTAMVYPLVVVSVAYLFFLFLVYDYFPRMLRMLADTRAAADSVLQAIESVSRTMPYWGPAVPILLVVAGLWSGVIPSAASRSPSLVLRRLRWLPWLGRILADIQQASFCELLGLLVERNVPLPDALELAGSASGDSRIRRECGGLAGRLRDGMPLDEAARFSTRLPPFLRWMLISGQRHGALAAVMGTLGDIYRRRARSRMEMFRLSAPLVLTIGLGGGAVFVYTLLMFLPMRQVFLQLSRF